MSVKVSAVVNKANTIQYIIHFTYSMKKQTRNGWCNRFVNQHITNTENKALT